VSIFDKGLFLAGKGIMAQQLQST